MFSIDGAENSSVHIYSAIVRQATEHYDALGGHPRVLMLEDVMLKRGG